MQKINDVITKLEDFAPIDLVEDWDNSGWQIKLENEEVSKIMLALSPTLDVVEQAIEKGCELLITHHPLFFSKLKKIEPKTIQNKVAIKAIQNNLQIYSAHTNLDKTQGGINDLLAKLLGLSEVYDVEGIVRVGKIEPTDLREFIAKIKSVLACEKVKLINPLNIKNIKTVAICSGSGSDYANKVEADLFVTGDVKYHTAIDVQDIAIIDAGHFETEKIVCPYLVELFSGVEVFVAQEKLPWELL